MFALCATFGLQTICENHGGTSKQPIIKARVPSKLCGMRNRTGASTQSRSLEGMLIKAGFTFISDLMIVFFRNPEVLEYFPLSTYGDNRLEKVFQAWHAFCLSIIQIIA